MNFETYLNQSWKDHPTQSEKIASEFSSGASLVKTNEELGQLVGLVTHVMGEHLARWNDGVSFLSSLKTHSTFVKGSETDKSILRSIAALQLGSGQSPDLKSFNHSDQIRIYAVASSALSEKDSKQSQNLLRQALHLAETGLDRKDPANRALAVTGNNVACSLEEKKSRSNDDTEMMILASQTARKYWEIFGDAADVAQAEYRLSMSYLQAEDLEKAFRHAQLCVELSRESNAGNKYMLYAYEALALVEKKKENSLGFQKAVDQVKDYFEKLSDDDKKSCESTLKKLIEANPKTLGKKE